MEDFLPWEPEGIPQRESSFFGSWKYEICDALRSQKESFRSAVVKNLNLCSLINIRFPELFPVPRGVGQDKQQAYPKGW